MLWDRLKFLRASRGISQADLAKKLGVTQQAVGRWEREQTSPDYAMLKRLSQFFGVSIDYLLSNDDNDSPMMAQALEAHESIAPYGKSAKQKADLDILLERGGYLTYSDKPLTEQQKEILREFVKVLVKEESSDAEAPANRH